MTKYVFKVRICSQVKVDNNKSTLRKLRGGRLADMPDGPPPRPATIPPKMWDSLTTKYNTSQLFAIQYVGRRTHAALDTQIALIQGIGDVGAPSLLHSFFLTLILVVLVISVMLFILFTECL